MMKIMRVPKVLVSYPGPDPSGNTFDVYVYLRPETNGVLTESVLMKTLVEDPEWHEKVKLVYLANYPGEFIQTRHLIEHHYRTRVYFARNGASVFTDGMAMAFENRFGVNFDETVSENRILGAFDALKVTGMGEEELFNYRVNEEDMLEVLGQNIKRRGNLWIVNYDIPAILHKNDSRTDIAVMVFRVSLSWQGFRRVLNAMNRHLAEAGLMSPDTPPGRVFHHSRSPWEQLMDGIDFLWGVDVSDGGAEDDISFGSYMMNCGFSRDMLRSVISRPLLEFPANAFASDDQAPGIPGVRPEIREGNIFEMSAGMTYAEAGDLLQRLQP